MRKTKVKEIRKFVVLASAFFMLATGSAFAASTWSDVQADVAAGNTVSVTGTIQTDGNAVVITPPVPSVTIDGTNGSFIDMQGNGYAFGNASNLIINNTGFINGSVSGSNGGAIQNSGSLTVNGTMLSENPSTSNTSFQNNRVVGYGGAISNTGAGTADIKSYQFTGNIATEVTAAPGVPGVQGGIGGAIYSNSTATGTALSVDNSLFYQNSARNFGGAIANVKGIANISNSNFIENQVGVVDGVKNSGAQGGAIVNAATMNITGSSFTGNTAADMGGAIANSLATSLGTGAITQDNDVVLTIDNTVFSSNSSEAGGGAIYNKGSEDNHYNIVNLNQGVVFKDNYSATTANDGTVNALTAGGGAILNASANVVAPENHDGIINVLGTENNKVIFQNNVALNGGAIQNAGKLNITNAAFIGNGSSSATGNLQTALGGAIYNIRQNTNGENAVSIVRDTSFSANTAYRGGAVYNASGDVVVMDSTFDHNKANTSQNGGAVYGAAGSNTILRADAKDMTIGYYNNETDNSVVNAEDTVTFENGANASLQASRGNTLNIYSNVYGNGGATVNINNSYDDGINIYESTGTVRFANDAKIVKSNIILNGGRLSFDHDKNLGSVGLETEANNLTLNGGTLDLLNNEFGANQLYVNNLTLTKDTKVELDVNLNQAKMDSLISGTNVGSFGSDLDGDGNVDAATGNILVSAMKSTTDTNADSVDILFTDAEYLEGHVGLDSGAEVVEGPIYKYAVEHNSISHTGGTTGGLAAGEWFNFKRLGNSDAVLAGPVAAQAAFLLMDNIYRQSFANMDMVTLMTPEQRMAWKMRNKYASADALHRGVYAPNIIPEERDGWYLRPFTNFENVPLKNGPKVSNVFYGTLIGGESDIIDLGKGWDGNFSFFGAYHGSHQAYNGNSIWQNGGSVGGVATAYKGNFFTGITANIGASAARATNVFGAEDFPILMTGAAWKSGYNWGLMNNKLVIQPSYMMSYTFVNVFDYINSAGVNISQDPLHAMEFIPGIKIIGNLPNGWQPYAAVNMTWLAMDRTKFYANDVALTRLGIKPFVEYGVGLQKRYGDRFTGFGQAMLRNGGRNGIAFTLGMRWALGN